MKNPFIIFCIFLLAGALTNCASSKRYHETQLGDPAAYKAHFSDLDASSDGLVSWDEFHNYFPNSNSNVYNALDLNKDNSVDHDEWHAFKEAHGLKSH